MPLVLLVAIYSTIDWLEVEFTEVTAPSSALEKIKSQGELTRGRNTLRSNISRIVDPRRRGGVERQKWVATIPGRDFLIVFF
jgi:hypothetical protein